MLTKRIKYTDFNGQSREEDFQFNLSKAELMEMEMGTAGGLEQMFRRIVEAQDTEAIIREFKNLILKAYGEKSPDGKFFLKEDDNGRPLYKKFEQTDAYSELFMELSTDADAAAAFINGIVPKNIAEQVKEETRNNPEMARLAEHK